MLRDCTSVTAILKCGAESELARKKKGGALKEGYKEWGKRKKKGKVKERETASVSRSNHEQRNDRNGKA